MRVEGFVILLLFFALILLALLYYLNQVDKNIASFDHYFSKMEELRKLEERESHLFLKPYRFLNYDELVYLSSEFETILTSLKKDPYTKEISSSFHRELEKIESQHREKVELVERFKSLNTRVTHALHYMFDLRKSIKLQYAEETMKINVLDRILFKAGQIIMDIPFEHEHMESDLKELDRFRDTDAKFNYFYRQTQMFLQDSKKIKQIIAKNNGLFLNRNISKSLKTMSVYNKLNRFKHRVITFSFFAFAFLILFILVLNYRQVQRTTRELKAFRYAIENSDNSIIITDYERRIQYVNEAFEETSGYTKNEVIGQNPNILKSNRLSKAFYDEMNQMIEHGKVWKGELINKRKDGKLLYEKSSIIPVAVDNEIVEYVAIKLNITDYKEQQLKLQQSAVVYETIGDGIMITDSEKKILSVNPAFISMFGYEESELLGEGPTFISSPNHDKSFYRRLWYSLYSHLTNDRWAGKVYNQTKNGEIIPIWLTIKVVRDATGLIKNFIAIYTNLQEIIEMEEKVDFLAYHDSLTKLPNRAYFEHEIVRVFETAKSRESKVGVLFVDLDRFKIINDTLGHQIGDELLVYIANNIKSVLRQDDLIARLGGDEFVVILDNLKAKSDAVVMADKILTIVKEPIKVRNYHLHTTASIGIAVYPNDGEQTSEIIKHANSAMYHAKEKGKNRYEFYTEQLSVNLQFRLLMEQELKHALKDNEIYVVYQPQYDLKSGKICGAEALVRWHNQALGYVNPEHFITIAEETGAIMEIGDFVLEEACKEFLKWQEQGFEIETVSINVSSTQFRRQELFGNFRTIIDKVGIPPEFLEIEITERFIWEYTIANMTVLEELRELGCKISIDDFGTGYSSLSYMKSLPLDAIKIDKSFINDLPYDTHDAEVSKAIIALSKSLGYRVIAEGIENDEQEAFLKSNGCDIGQGFHFARPMEAEIFTAFAREKNLAQKSDKLMFLR